MDDTVLTVLKNVLHLANPASFPPLSHTNIRKDNIYRVYSTDLQSARLCLQTSELAPPLHPEASVAFVSGRGTHLRERGRGGEPIRTKVQTLWYSRYTLE